VIGTLTDLEERDAKSSTLAWQTVVDIISKLQLSASKIPRHFLDFNVR
jgi:hypothetical protein